MWTGAKTCPASSTRWHGDAVLCCSLRMGSLLLGVVEVGLSMVTLESMVTVSMTA